MERFVLKWEIAGHTFSHPIQEQGELLIGRRNDCHIVLDWETISRQHAAIYFTDQTLNVRNLSQSNSVKVNGQLRLSYNQTSQLRPGDVIRIGPVELTLDTEKSGQTTKIRCINCNRIQDYNPQGFCQWCGMALAGGQTVFP